MLACAFVIFFTNIFVQQWTVILKWNEMADWQKQHVCIKFCSGKNKSQKPIKCFKQALGDNAMGSTHSHCDQRMRGRSKAISRSCWSDFLTEGIVHKFIPPGQRVNQHTCTKVLRCLREASGTTTDWLKPQLLPLKVPELIRILTKPAFLWMVMIQLVCTYHSNY